MNLQDHQARYVFTFHLPSGKSVSTEELDKTSFEFILEYIAKFQSGESTCSYMMVPRSERLDAFNPYFINLLTIEGYDYQIFKIQKKGSRYVSVKQGEEKPEKEPTIEEIDRLEEESKDYPVITTLPTKEDRGDVTRNPDTNTNKTITSGVNLQEASAGGVRESEVGGGESQLTLNEIIEMKQQQPSPFPRITSVVTEKVDTNESGDLL